MCKVKKHCKVKVKSICNGFRIYLLHTKILTKTGPMVY